MLKRWLGLLLGIRPAPTDPTLIGTSSVPVWRETPVLRIREDVGLGIVAEMTVTAGHHGFVGVVGESHYQSALVAALRSKPGEDAPVFTAGLNPEPSNTHDPNAVAVVIEPFGTVGYLPANVAKQYSPRLRAQENAVTCPVQLRVGSAAAPHIGAVLDFEVVRGRLGLPLMAVDQSGMNYEAVVEYHKLNQQARDIVKHTRALEAQDLARAASRHRDALQLIRDAHEVAERGGLLAFGFLPNQTDMAALERLIICLVKLGRVAEASDEANRFVADFPHATAFTIVGAIQKRIARATQ